MMRFHGVLLSLGLAFLVYLVWETGIAKLWRELASLGWGLLPLILCEGLGELVHTLGWRRCLNGPQAALPLGRLFGIRMAGYAINNLTPSAGMGGEMTRAALLASHHEGPEAVSGVLIDKVCFAAAQLLFVLVGSVPVLGLIHFPRGWWAAMLSCSTLVAGGILAFLLLQKYGKLGVVMRWLAARKLGGPMVEKAAREATKVDEALRLFYSERPLDLGAAVGWHLLGHAVGIAPTWLFFRLLNQNASAAVAASAWLLGMWFDTLTFAIPMNAGTLEGSRIVAFKALGYNALLGLTYGTTLRMAQLFWALFGLASYGLLVLRTRTRLDFRPRSSIQKQWSRSR